MTFPPILPIGFATMQYVILGYTVFVGVLQVYQARYKGLEVKKSKTIWLGALNVVVGAIAYFQSYREAMEAIAAAGDISPSLIADGMSQAFSFPILGLTNLGFAFLIRYLVD